VNARAQLGALIACAALAGCGAGDEQRRDRSTATTPPVPGPIIGSPQPAGRDPLNRQDRAAARAATTTFLADYLPYLYGRGPASAIKPVSPSVARALRGGRARTPPAQAARRPRVRSLQLVGQSSISALATATIVDGGPASYLLTLTVERRDGRWLIADLGDDR